MSCTNSMEDMDHGNAGEKIISSPGSIIYPMIGAMQRVCLDDDISSSKQTNPDNSESVDSGETTSGDDENSGKSTITNEGSSNENDISDKISRNSSLRSGMIRMSPDGSHDHQSGTDLSIEEKETALMEKQFLDHRLDTRYETHRDSHPMASLYVESDQDRLKFYMDKVCIDEKERSTISSGENRRPQQETRRESMKKVSSFRDIVHLFSTMTKGKRKMKDKLNERPIESNRILDSELVTLEKNTSPSVSGKGKLDDTHHDSFPQTGRLIPDRETTRGRTPHSPPIPIVSKRPSVSGMSDEVSTLKPARIVEQNYSNEISIRPSSFDHRRSRVLQPKSGEITISGSPMIGTQSLLSSSAPHSKPIKSPKHTRSFKDLRMFFKGHEEIHHDPYFGHLTDRYEIVDKLGKGSGGIVRLARKLNANKLYAVKEFTRRRNKETERDLDKRVTSEFCIGSLLHHDNIVETVDIIHEGTHWYEVLEYCSGGDLFSIIRNAQMTVVEINCCFKQLIQGVAYLHSVGVAHRDIKPENLLIDEHGRLKLSDFGVSSVFQVAWEHEEHKFKGVCGSKPYMAPEVFNTDEYDACKVDVWACGIVFYAMNFNGVPWLSALGSDPCYSYYLRHHDMNFNPFNQLNQDAKDLLRKILDPDPRRRVTIQDIINNAWFNRIECCTDKDPSSHSHRPHYHLGYNIVSKGKS